MPGSRKEGYFCLLRILPLVLDLSSLTKVLPIEPVVENECPGCVSSRQQSSFGKKKSFGRLASAQLQFFHVFRIVNTVFGAIFIATSPRDTPTST